ncbi:ATP-binding cassette domain-containing protein [Rhodopseudomonas sp. P2A-2r]|uniref:ATP-binding cassette domain-containing protein n=1 Tax=Rhodopseudomonas sp. P2A-2r TaxID=2991972 RepID=UPI00223430DE|nr:ATP-binding cassette domain-containing protein [Rhodopseudomonas sp. P2A-2r]UZE52205.1 ATP-binding cassette domain-containing protein [Rhodopseudomonas sp. P2A-2r]
MLAAATAASGILLTGISVWFLGAVALAGLGPAALLFNFHTPAAFVRLFALSKTVGKYGERVVGHRAALLDQVRRRSQLFIAMARAPMTRAASWQLGNQDRLSDYMEDVEDVDYARLRVGMPAAVLLAGLVVLTGATALLAPLALVPIAVVLAAIAMALRHAMPRATALWTAARSSQRSAGRRLGAALGAVVPLQAERAFPVVLAAGFAHFNEVESNRLAQKRALAVLDMVAGLAGPLAAVSILLAAWYAGDRGAALLVPAFIAFGWLALGETVQNVSRIVLGRVRQEAATESLRDWASTGSEPALSSDTPRLQTMVLRNVPRQAPDGRRLGDPVNLTFRAGHPTALLGASGSGKTTLLKQIAGWVGADSRGQFIGNGVVMLSAYRRALSHLCLHDAAILSDTVRENLFASHRSDADCWRALAIVELEDRMELAGGLDAWITQDMFSLGECQRLNLARALLSDSPIVLLDEPVEHLDSGQATRLLKRTLSELAGRIVIYSTHGDFEVNEVIRVPLTPHR